MRRHFKYLLYVLRHKWFVMVAGLSLRVSIWQLIKHDWHKFTPGEWFPYARCFYEPNGTKQYKPDGTFTVAWNAHQKRGKHHWQYWLITWDHGGTEAIEMPDKYRREMLADWMGAGRAITGKDNTLEWYTDNRRKMHLHDKTRRWVDVMLGYREDYAPHQVIAFMRETFKLTGSIEEAENQTREIFCDDGFSESGNKTPRDKVTESD